MKIVGKVAAIICGVLLLLVVSLQILLNTPSVTHLVERYAYEYIDGELDLSRLHFSIIRNFPKLRVTVDTLSITYPHSRYSAYDNSPVKSRLLDAGRGEYADTLLRFDRFTASANPFRLISGRLRLSDARLYGLSVYAHQFDTTANWKMFLAPEKEKEENDSTLSLPWISVGEILLDRLRAVYTDQCDTMFLDAAVRRVRLSGNAKVGGDEIVSLRKVYFRLDSLMARGRFPADTMAVALNYLYVDNPLRHIYNVGMESGLIAMTDAFGRVRIPVELKAEFDIDRTARRERIDMPMLRAELAHIPLEARGKLWRMGDSTNVRLHCEIDDCDLGRILKEYGPSITPVASDLSTDAHISMAVDADGCISDGSVPDISASVRIPESKVYYRPFDLASSLKLDVDGSMDQRKYVKAAVRELTLHGSGLNLNFVGCADDLLGRNPVFDVHAKGNAVVDSLDRFFPKDAGFSTGGNLSLKVDVKTDKDELQTYRFRKSVISGQILSDYLSFSMPGDSIDARVRKSEILLSSGADGLNLSTDMKSISFGKGREIMARVHDMKNNLRMYKVDSRGTSVPRLSFNTDNGSVFVKVGSNRIGLFGARVGAAMQMRALANNRKEQIRHFVDSLHRSYPGVPRDSLLHVVTSGKNARIPAYLKEDEFSSRDIEINLDSTITKYLKIWKPSGSIEISKGFFSTPVLPLRTRINDFRGGFTDNEIVLDSIAVVSGTSDVSAKGRVSGLRRVIFGKGLIRTNLDIKADRVNLNEIFVALDRGKTIVDTDKDTESETEGTFVVDSIAGAKATVDMIPVAVVPGNLDATVSMATGTVEFMDITANNTMADIKIKDRTLQVTDAAAKTNLGDVGVNAYFSTKSWDDMSMGADLRLRDISAAGIIRMIPTVDNLLPALKSFDGKLALDLSMTSQLDSSLNVIIPSVDGIMRISGTDLMISDAGDLRRVTGLLGFKNKNIGHIDDLYVDAVVHDSKLEVFPFELSVDRYKFALRGTQGYDKSMNYHISVLKSPFLIPFGINIYGYTYNWRFLLGFPKYQEGKVPVYTAQLDTMQVNVLKSIRNIYRNGVDSARERIRKSSAEAYSSAVKSPEYAIPGNQDYSGLDSLSFEMAVAEADALLDAEVDEALASSVIDIDSLVREYEASTEDKFINRRINQLGKKK